MRSRTSIAIGRKNIHRSLLCVAALASVAGLAAPVALAQQDRPAPARQDGRPVAAEAGTVFVPAGKLIGANIVNASDDTVGEIKDLVIDRGAGGVRSVVVKSGGMLGLGGKSVAIPYSSLRWSRPDGKPLLDLTGEQLRAFPTFDEDEITRRTTVRQGEPTYIDRIWDSGLSGETRIETDEALAGEREKITGTIRSVDRETVNGRDYVVVTVTTPEKIDRRIALGPAWYVSMSPAAPMRGEKFEANVVKAPGSTGVYALAADARIADRELRLRDEAGEPRWAPREGTTPNGELHTGGAARLALASDIRGAKAQCRGQDSGKIEELIIEKHSGTVAFASIDPDEKFLGMGDADRLIPWSVISFGTDNVARVDASKDMLLASHTTPSDISSLNARPVYEKVYKTYDVRTPDFRADNRRSSADGWGRDGMPKSGDNARSAAWAHDGELSRTIAKGEKMNIKGRVVEIRNMDLGAGTESGRAIVVDTGSAKEVIYVGPAWFVDEKQMVREGANVTIEARRARIGGQDRVVAWSIDRDGTRTPLWTNDRPAWDNR